MNLPAAVAISLAIFGVFALFLGAWFAAVDTAISRMTIAYAEDLVEQQRKGSHTLRQAVRERREVGSSLASARVLSTTVGIVSLTFVLVNEFWDLDWKWWLTLAVTLAIVAAVQLLALGFSTQLNAGSRYVKVALVGSKSALRILTRRDHVEVVPEARLAMVDELRELLDEVSEDGEPAPLEEADRKILRSVFELGQTRVGELMVPRAEMVTIKGDEDGHAAFELFVTSGFSRMPVIGKTLDEVQGVLYMKDLARRSLKGHDALDIKVRDIARAAAFVPEMKLADDELRVMQANNTHLALVVDEYGGIAGLVTAEDILEELVGELTDEHDVDVGSPEEVEPGVWLIPSSYPIDDLEDLLDVEFDEDELYSVGGLLTKAIGRVPLPGDSAEVNGVLIEAGEQTGRRKRVLSVYVRRG